MMYHSKFASAIKVNGKVLREQGDKVYIPFSSEYSIYLKNLNTERAVVYITIDGNDVTGNGGLVLDPNQSIDFERSLSNGDLTAGNRFKFIERTNSVEEHRGVGALDGLIRIEYQFELPTPKYTPSFTHWRDNSGTIRGLGGDYYVKGGLGVCGSLGPRGDSGTLYRGLVSNCAADSSTFMGSSTTVFNSATATSSYADTEVQCCATNINNVGITVPGSLSNQKFTTTVMGALDPHKHVIVYQMLGETPNQRVTAPVTVKAKPKCVTCGRVNKATAKFCTNCGTSLVLI